MWCRCCQQDVPGIPSEGMGGYCCPRCGEPFSRRSGEIRPGTPALASAVALAEAEAPPTTLTESHLSASQAPESPPPGENWEFDEQLAHIARLLGVEPPVEVDRERSRLDSSHRAPAEAAAPDKEKFDLRRWGRQLQSWQARRLFPVLCWLAVLVGTMAASCGGMLLAWSAASGREELRAIGMPIALAGGAALAVGIFLELDRRRGRAPAPVAGQPPDLIPREPTGPMVRIDAAEASPGEQNLAASEVVAPRLP